MANKRKTREERIDEIMDAAMKLFCSKGYQASTMEDIIAETELSKGGFYHYYGRKKDILIDMMARGNMQYMRYNPFMQEIRPEMDKDEKVELLLEAYLDKCLQVTNEKCVYAMFLYEGMMDEDIWRAFLKYEVDFMIFMFNKLGLEQVKDLNDYYLLSRLLNGLLLGQHTSRDHNCLLDNRDEIKNMLKPLVMRLVG